MDAIRITPENRREAIARAAAVLRDGGVVLFPTDTVYGLAAHPDHPGALKRICRIKGRDDGKPVAFLASGREAPLRSGARPTPAAQAFARRFWPGSLTLVLRCEDGRTEGFRVPDSALARDLVAACGGLLRVTSANRSGEPAACAIDGAIAPVADLCDLVLDDGPSRVGVASTVVIDGEAGWTVPREGAVTKAMLEACAREAEDAPG